MQDDVNHSANGPGAGRPAPTSTTLLERAKGGEAEAWSRLVALYSPLVLWWCRRRGLGPHDAEDVAQEVLATVHARIAGFRKEGQCGSFRGWLRSITHNKVGDYYRRRQRDEARAAGGSDAHDRLNQVPAETSEEGAADDAAEHGILSRRALELIRAEFEPRTWEMAWRVAVDGHSPSDVASDLGVSVGTVYSAKSRVLGRLRRELGDVVE
jgi:RNA polymerase sigma-70 factor (ECF subfamily)